MQIFGLEPILAAVIITIIGITLYLVLGWAKGTIKIGGKLIIIVFITTFVVSIQVVATEIALLPDKVQDLELLPLIVGLIAQVAGLSTVFNSAGKIAGKQLNKTSKDQ